MNIHVPVEVVESDVCMVPAPCKVLTVRPFQNQNIPHQKYIWGIDLHVVVRTPWQYNDLFHPNSTLELLKSRVISRLDDTESTSVHLCTCVTFMDK